MNKTAAAALMSYYVAVKAVGTVDTATVKESLINMSTFNSFMVCPSHTD
jgi:hypothetical protein